MKTVMVTGNFDGFHSDHLEYIEAATKYGDNIIVIIATDKQVIQKKGFVNIPERKRYKLVDTVLKGIGCKYQLFLNIWDTRTPHIAEAIRYWKPQVLLRGYDKDNTDMPFNELTACRANNVDIAYARDNSHHDIHSSRIWGGK